MDFRSLIRDEELIEYTSNLNYSTGDKSELLFPARKVSNPIVTMRSIMEGGNIDVMAHAHAEDTEARIGNRQNIEEINLEAILVKEKLPTSERLTKMLQLNAGKSEILDFVFNDVDTLVRRNLVRNKVMRYELLSSGLVTVKENNIAKTYDYHVPASHRIGISEWDDPAHNILADIERIKAFATKSGYKIVRAITSSTMVGYMVANKEIRNFWASSVTPLTQNGLLVWLRDNYGIEFVPNDEVYKTDALDTETHRYFDENTITWLTTDGVLGAGLYGVTPEQRISLKLPDVREKMLVTVTTWAQPDPAIVWTKGSSVYIPVIRDINGLFISKHTPKAAVGG